MRLVVGVSGASGALYAERLLVALAGSSHHVDIVGTKIGAEIFLQETGRSLATFVERHASAGASFRLWDRDDLYAPFSSGSQIYDAMAIVPCSAGTLGRIAAGVSTDLLSRGADVFLKEKRRLVLALRETPLSEIHLQNMLTLRRAGAVVLPASPGFYTHPRDLVELADSLVQRILDHMGVELRIHKRWREHPKRQDAPSARARSTDGRPSPTDKPAAASEHDATRS
jgi:4-hydroxy-3-polyprenylbenzoate decarboxylase